MNYKSDSGARKLGSLEGGRTLLAVPQLTRARFLREAYAREVEPLVEAGLVVARYHIAVGDVIAEAVGRLLAGASWHAISLGLQSCSSTLHFT